MPVLLLLVMITGVQQHTKLVLIFLVQSFKIILSTSSAGLLILNPTVGPKRPPPLDPVFTSNTSGFFAPSPTTSPRNWHSQAIFSLQGSVFHIF